jgi:hypothetical protein
MDDDKVLLQELSNTLSELSGEWGEQINQIGFDLEFYGGKQWDEKRLKNRVGRPTLVDNQVSLYVNRIVNAARMNPYGIGITCEVPEVAELLRKKVEEIEYKSNAKDAYCTALEHATIGGLGYIHISHDYTDDSGLAQEIKICKVNDPRKVYLDPFAEGVSDARYAVYFSHLSKGRAKVYGEEATKGSIAGIDVYKGWIVPANMVCDIYWYRIKEARKVRYFLSDGSFVDEKPNDVDVALAGLEVVGSREITKKRLQSIRVVGSKVVAKSEMDCEFIPIVPVFGKVIYQEDLRYGGIVRDLRDLQQALNYTISTETELIANAPKAPFVIGTTQVQGLEAFWDKAASDAPVYLPYNPVAGVAPPARADNTAQTQQLAFTRQSLQSDMGRVTGIFDAQLGAGEVEQSGIALQVRNSAGDIASALYIENLEQSVQQVGRVVLGMMRSINDSEEVLEVDGQQVSVSFSELLDQYEVDVKADAGPSYETRRREGVASLLQLIDSIPENEKPKFLDLVAQQLEMPNKDEVLDRLKPLTGQGSDGEMDPQALEALQVAEQTIGELQQTVSQAGAIIQQLQGLLISKDKELSTKLEIERIKTERDLALTLIKEQATNDRQDQKVAAEANKEVASIVADAQAQENEIIGNLAVESVKEDAKLAQEVIKANAKTRTAGPLTL